MTSSLKFLLVYVTVLTALISALAASAFAATRLKNAPGSGNVEFLAVGKPSMLKIHGTGAGPSASLEASESQVHGKITFELGKLDTGIGLRTEHMKEKYLQVKLYPAATLTLLEAPCDNAFASSLSNTSEKPFKGTLELHGKSHEVKGAYSATGGTVKANFTLALTDYGIDVPKYLGVTVADSVDVTVEVPLRKE